MTATDWSMRVWIVDNDGDGIADTDCRDDISTINPGAAERAGDGNDDDCDGARRGMQHIRRLFRMAA